MWRADRRGRSPERGLISLLQLPPSSPASMSPAGWCSKFAVVSFYGHCLDNVDRVFSEICANDREGRAASLFALQAGEKLRR